jgi:hypothetical protein
MGQIPEMSSSLPVRLKRGPIDESFSITCSRESYLEPGRSARLAAG